MAASISALLGELKTGLSHVYGSRLRGVYLYGSHARHEADDESDVDVLVVLDDVPDYAAELERTSPIVARLSLKYRVAISRVFVPRRDWAARDTSFLANVREEAIRA